MIRPPQWERVKDDRGQAVAHMRPVVRVRTEYTRTAYDTFNA